MAEPAAMPPGQAVEASAAPVRDRARGLPRRVPQAPGRARLDEAVLALAQAPTTALPFDDLARHLACAVKRVLLPDGEVGLHPVDAGGRLLPPASTGRATAAVDRTQHGAAVGPCRAALLHGRIVRVDDVRSTRHIGTAFAAAAAAAGVRAALAVPLATPGAPPVGVLALYAPAPASLDRGHEAAARRLAVPVAAALADARAYHDCAGRAASLLEAVASRVMVEQATGLIAASSGCGPDEAFALLVRASQREGSRARDLARRLVEGPGVPYPAT
jgi:hypothetical protein